MKIRKYKDFVNEMTEFNVLRLNSDSVRVATQVDDPQLSINAFDKHEDSIRQAMSRIDDILFNIKGTSAYSTLRSKLALEEQDIQKLIVQKILKQDDVHYDVYVVITVNDEEYWGKISDILGLQPKFTSEVFKDFDLYQPKEWVIKIQGVVIKTVKQWLKPENGKYRLLNDQIICYSTETGKQLKMNKDIEIEVIRAHDTKIVIKYEQDTYNLVGDNYIYFNWWFQKIN